MASSFSGYRDESLNDIFLITNDEWNWYDYSSFEFLLTKRATRVQMIGSYVRAWRKIDGDWQPNDPASFIQPNHFANNKCIGIPRTAPSNSLSGTADTFGCTGWQDHTGRLALTWTAPWPLIVAGSYTVQSGPYTGPVVDRIPAVRPAVRPVHGDAVERPLGAEPARHDHSLRRNGSRRSSGQGEGT